MALLADPATTSIGSYRYVATVIAHELAHQWFGNLVTMEWWNDHGSTESFATLMEYISVGCARAELGKYGSTSDTNESVVALQRDSYDGVQAVQVDVNSPDEISTLFDGAIVYRQGRTLTTHDSNIRRQRRVSSRAEGILQKTRLRQHCR